MFAIQFCLSTIDSFTQSNILLTGGEDSKINVWTAKGSSESVVLTKRGNDVDPMDIDEDDMSGRKKRRA